IARTPRVPIASESPASVDLQPFGPSRKRDLTRFAGAGRKPRTRAAYSQIRPPSETRNQLLKYQPQFPERFGCIEDARGFLRFYFDWYNQDHHHVGIGLMTPNQVHYGQANAVYAARQHTLDRACRQHPERFVNRPPTPPAKPSATWINPPSAKLKPLIDAGTADADRQTQNSASLIVANPVDATVRAEAAEVAVAQGDIFLN